MKHYQLIHSLLRIKGNFVSIFVITVVCIFLGLEQTIRNLHHGNLWWFDSISSCHYVLFLFTIAMICLSEKKIDAPDCNVPTPVINQLKGRFYLNLIYCTAVSILWFPFLYYYGIHWQFLLGTYLYCVGFVNVCMFPLVLYCNHHSQETTQKKLFPIIVLLVSWGIPFLLDTIDYEDTSALLLSIIGCIGMFSHKVIANMLAKIYEEK